MYQPPARSSFKLPQSAGSLFALSPLLAPASGTAPAPLQLSQAPSSQPSPRNSFSMPRPARAVLITSSPASPTSASAPPREMLASLTLNHSSHATTHVGVTNSNSAPPVSDPPSLLSALRAGPLRRATSGETSHSGSSSTASSLSSSSPPSTGSPIGSPLGSPSSAANPKTGKTPFSFGSATSAARHIPIRANSNSSHTTSSVPVASSARAPKHGRFPSGSPPVESRFASSLPGSSPPPLHPGFKSAMAATGANGSATSSTLAPATRSDAVAALRVQTDAAAAKRGGQQPQSPALLLSTPITPLTDDTGASEEGDTEADANSDSKSTALTTASTAVEASHQQLGMPTLVPEAASVDEFQVVSRIDTGNTCGVFLVEDKKSGRRAIFKPMDQYVRGCCLLALSVSSR